MKDLFDKFFDMDKNKLNCEVTVVVNNGKAKTEIKGNAAAILMGFQAYAAAIMTCGAFKDTNPEELASVLCGAVDLAETLASLQKAVDGE